MQDATEAAAATQEHAPAVAHLDESLRLEHRQRLAQ